MTAKLRRLAVLSVSGGGLNRSFFAPDRPEFAGHDVREDVFVMPGLFSPRLLIALCVKLLSTRYDLVTSNEYRLFFVVNALLFLFRRRARHVALGFNLSKRPLRFGVGPLDRLINRIIRRNAFFVVHSRHEIGLFRDLHGISEERIVFAHWGFDLPAWDRAAFARPEGRYFCCIGRNNRDFGAFVRAVDRLRGRGVIIAPGYADLPAQPSAHVTALRDRPLSECIACIEGAIASVTPLLDDNRGAGHITSVVAMHLGRPQIVSRAAAVSDYVIDGWNALLAPIGDDAALKDAMEALAGDPQTCARLGRNGAEIARRFLSSDAMFARIAGVLLAVAEGRRPAQIDPAWLAFQAEMATETASRAPSVSPRSSS